MRRALRALGRGMLKRCARCGQGRLFRRWFRLLERCPRCGLRFEREPGFWVGALIVNMAVTSMAFVAALAVGIIATAPDVPWIPLTVVCAAVNLLVPVLFYPWSKTIWMAIDLIMHRIDPQDRDVGGNGDPRAQVIPPGGI